MLSPGLMAAVTSASVVSSSSPSALPSPSQAAVPAPPRKFHPDVALPEQLASDVLAKLSKVRKEKREMGAHTMCALWSVLAVLVVHAA